MGEALGNCAATQSRSQDVRAQLLFHLFVVTVAAICLAVVVYFVLRQSFPRYPRMALNS